MLVTCDGFCMPKPNTEKTPVFKAKSTFPLLFLERAVLMCLSSFNKLKKKTGISLELLISGIGFNCSISERIKKFYRCANAIFRIDGYSDELVMLQLAESHCIPLLTYAIEIVHVANRDERRQLRVAYNSVFRKIFGYRWSQSVSELQKFLRRPTWEDLVDSRKNWLS